MFTGLIEAIGVVKSVQRQSSGLRLVLDAGTIAEGARPGDSVAVNGACLTVAAVRGAVLEFDAVRETVIRTNLDSISAGARVNLELPVKLGDRLGGHIVQGHVDGVGVVRRIEKRGDSAEMEISADSAILRYVVLKGSVAVDGVSLTVAAVLPRGFRVALVPTTLASTTLGERKPGDRVNIETDILAKYVEKTSAPSGEVTEEMLERAGFI